MIQKLKEACLCRGTQPWRGILGCLLPTYFPTTAYLPALAFPYQGGAISRGPESPFPRSSLFICPASGSQPFLLPTLIICASEVSLRPMDSASISWSLPSRRGSPVMLFLLLATFKKGHYLPTLVYQQRPEQVLSILCSHSSLHMLL